MDSACLAGCSHVTQLHAFAERVIDPGCLELEQDACMTGITMVLLLVMMPRGLLQGNSHAAAVISKRQASKQEKESKQAKAKQRKLFLESVSDSEPESVQAPVTEQEDEMSADHQAEQAADEDIPATYNNMPLHCQAKNRRINHSDHEEDGEEMNQPRADIKQHSNVGGQCKRQKQTAKGRAQDMEFAVSDDGSDEYEPTQAKAAAKAAAKKTADRAGQPTAHKNQAGQPKQGRKGSKLPSHEQQSAKATEVMLTLH